jgi:transposase InsO family protein
MSVRRLIVEVDVDGLNVREFCRAHGVSTWFFYELRRRFGAEGAGALEPRSRAPRRVANRIDAGVENRIVELRKELSDAGLDCGPASIWSYLQVRAVVPVPSEATIYRTLKARGLIVADPSKAPASKGCRFVAARANELWQLDDTTWHLDDGTDVKILNVVDDHSRLLVASVALTAVTGADALAVLAAAAATWGWPARFLSDNAKAFRHVLADALHELGIGSCHSRAHHPQTNGKVERFHQTLKQRLRRQARASTLTELQTQLDRFRVIYNHQRPHRALGRRFPADVWSAAPKTGPSPRPLGTPTRIYHGIVNGGTFRVARRWRISLGAELNHQPGIAVVTGLECHVFVNGRLARKLTLNPDRVDQPRYTRPGRPSLKCEG